MPRPRGHLGLPPPHRLPPSAQYSKAGGGNWEAGSNWWRPCRYWGGLQVLGGLSNALIPPCPGGPKALGGGHNGAAHPGGGVPAGPRGPQEGPCWYWGVPRGLCPLQPLQSHHIPVVPMHWGGGQDGSAYSRGVPVSTGGGHRVVPASTTTLTPPCPSAPPVPGGSKLGSLPI